MLDSPEGFSLSPEALLYAKVSIAAVAGCHLASRSSETSKFPARAFGALWKTSEDRRHGNLTRIFQELSHAYEE